MLLIDPESGDVVEQWPGIWGGAADMDVAPSGDVIAMSGSFTTRVQLFELPSGRQRPDPAGAAGWMQDIAGWSRRKNHGNGNQYQRNVVDDTAFSQ